MTGRSYTASEARVVISPIWVRLVDTFTGGPPSGPIGVQVELRRESRWVPWPAPHWLTLAGNLAFPNLGRTPPGAGGTLDLRVTATAPGTVTESADGDGWLRRTLTTWTPPYPAAPPAPGTLRFYPGPGYRFGAGIAVLSGRVEAATGDPADRARVSVVENVAGHPQAEEVRTGPDGAFRLPVRWSAGATRIDAALGTAAGFVVVDLPSGLRTHPIITIT